MNLEEEIVKMVKKLSDEAKIMFLTAINTET